MADNSFGIKELNLIDSGTPKIESPNNLNINAVNVAISTNATVGGNLDVDGHTELDDVNVSGVSTFSSANFDETVKVGSGVTIDPVGNANFAGVTTAYDVHAGNNLVTKGNNIHGSSRIIISGGGGLDTYYYSGGSSYSNHRFMDMQGGLTYERFRISPTGIDVTGIATVSNSVIVGSGVTISSSGDIFNTGITTIGKRVVGISTNNIIPFLYNNYSDLPSASTYHGAFVHVHVAGKALYAHAGAWTELVNVGSDLTVGLGTEKYNVGILTATSINVGTGVTISSDGDSFVTGVSTATKFVGDLSDSAISRWSVGNNGFSHYTFTGPGGLSSAEDPTIYLARGQTYEFNLNASGHPFQIQTTSGGYNAGNVYTTGITNAGAAVGVIKFEVPFSAPNTLYYVCQNHSSMAGTIVVYPSI